MKVMAEWSAQSGQFEEAVNLFLAGNGTPPEGLKMLGRWHSVDLGSGWVLFETDDATLIYRNSVKWSDVLDIRVSIVVEDTEAAPILTEHFK